MKQLLNILLVLITLNACAQNTGGSLLPPTKYQPINKSLLINGARSVDGKYKYYDTINFRERAFMSTTEANAYIPQNQRMTGLSVLINTGGTLSNGIITGGINNEYQFLNGITNNDLLPKASAVITDNTLKLSSGLLGTVPNYIQSVNLYSPTASRPSSLTQGGYFVPYIRPRLFFSDWTTFPGTPYARFSADCYSGSIGDTIELSVYDAADDGYITGSTAIVTAGTGATYISASDAQINGPDLNADDSSVVSTGNSFVGAAFGKSVAFLGITDNTFESTSGLYANSAGGMDTAGTVECFIRPSRLGIIEYIVGKWGLGGAPVGQYLLYKDAGNHIVVAFQDQDGTNRTITGTTVMSASTTYHIAFSYGSGRGKLWLNGGLEGQLVPSVFTSLNVASTAQFAIAKNNSPGDGYRPFQGSIDEVRVSNTDRYLTTFTPPVVPFTADYNTLLLYHLDDITVTNSNVLKLYTPFIGLSATTPIISKVKIRNQNGSRGQLYNLKMEIKYQ